MLKIYVSTGSTQQWHSMFAFHYIWLDMSLNTGTIYTYDHFLQLNQYLNPISAFNSKIKIIKFKTRNLALGLSCQLHHYLKTPLPAPLSSAIKHRLASLLIKRLIKETVTFCTLISYKLCHKNQLSRIPTYKKSVPPYLNSIVRK